MVLGVPILKHIRLYAGWSESAGTLKTINFSFGTNEKLIVLGVPNS